jgi:hypothetical protein
MRTAPPVVMINQKAMPVLHLKLPRSPGKKEERHKPEGKNGRRHSHDKPEAHDR